jgi:hypothetical protein
MSRLGQLTTSRIAQLRQALRLLPAGTKAGIGWAILWSLVIAGCVVWAIYSWTNHGSKKYGPDGSVLISTFITLYGLFFGGFGVLAGFVRKAPYIRLRPPW